MNLPLIQSPHISPSRSQYLLFLLLAFLLGSCVSTKGPVWKWVLDSRVYADLLIDGDNVFVVAQSGEVMCGNSRSGERLWLKKVDGQILGAPALSGSVIYTGTDRGDVHAFQKISGDRVWSKQLPEPVQAPLAATPEAVLVPTVRGTLYALAPSNGQILWSFPGNVKYNIGPILYGSYMFIGGWGKKFYCLRRDGKPVWEFQAASRITETPVIFRNTIYLPLYDHFVYALDVSNGKLKWSHPAKFPTNAVIVNNQAVFASEGHLYTLQPDSGKLLRRYTVGRPISRIYSRDERCILISSLPYEFDLQSGRLLPLIKTPNPTFKIAFAGGMIIVTDEVRSILGYRG